MGSANWMMTLQKTLLMGALLKEVSYCIAVLLYYVLKGEHIMQDSIRIQSFEGWLSNCTVNLLTFAIGSLRSLNHSLHNNTDALLI